MLSSPAASIGSPVNAAGTPKGSNGSGSGGDPAAQPSSSAAEGRLPQSSAPAFLLVHGFGAFGEQWRGQVKALTAAGYQVTSTAKPCPSEDGAVISLSFMH